MKYDEVISAINKKAPGESRSGSEQQKWIIINGIKRFRVTYPKKHPGEIPFGTLQSIRKQMKLEKSDFERFTKCHMSQTEYVAHLSQLITDGKI